MSEKKIKYRLTLTEKQAGVVAAACEFYARMRMGQFQEVSQQMLQLEPGGSDDYLRRREMVDDLLLLARKYVYPDLRGPGHSYGIGKFEDADRAFDVYQVLRQHFPHDGREPFSYHDLPECEVVEE